MPTRKCKLCSTLFEPENEKFIFCCIEHAREYKKPKIERNYSNNNSPYKLPRNKFPLIHSLDSSTERTLRNSDSEIPGFSIDWKYIAREIRKRDNYTCQFCFEVTDNSKTQLHVHHIIARKFLIGYPIELIEHPNNLISLCVKCHSQVECGKLKLSDCTIEKAYQVFKKEKDRFAE